MEGNHCLRSPDMRNCLRRSKLELRGPGNGLEIGPEALEGCALRRFSRGCRLRRRNGPAGVPEALLGGVRGTETPPEDTMRSAGFCIG
eukprot:11506351-Alexandrium_andersonii.AAC.1